MANLGLSAFASSSWNAPAKARIDARCCHEAPSGSGLQQLPSGFASSSIIGFCTGTLCRCASEMLYLPIAFVA